MPKPPRTLPRLVLPAGPVPALGHTVQTAEMRAALRVLRGVPAGFQHDIANLKGVASSRSGVVAVFGHGLHVVLGSTSALDLKLRVAARVLTNMGDSIRRSVAYVNVSAPARPDRRLQEVSLKLRYRLRPPNLLLDSEGGWG